MTLTTFSSALAFLIFGIAAYAVALLVVSRSLPGNLWREAIEEKNTSAAIVLAGIALGLGWIVAAAVH